MIETRAKQIFDYLTSDYEIHNSKEIGEVLELSSKTVHKEIQIVNSYINGKGAIIETLPGRGYQFKILNDKRFKTFLKNEWYKYAYFEQDSGNKESRIENILKLFLFSNSYIKQQELAEIFYVSTSQINKDIKVIRDILKEYQIKLISKPYYGMKIEGDEKSIRLAMRNEIGEDSEVFEKGNDEKLFNLIQDIISNIDFGPDFYMPYVNFKNLVIHIYISILRIKQGEFITLSKEVKDDLARYEELKIAKKITRALKEKLDIDFPYDEMVYLTMHLVAKNTITDHEKISSEVTELSQSMIDEIYAITKYDFRSNIDFYFALSLHLGPLIERIKYGLDMKNPILDDIKENQVAFILATVASNVINERYKMTLSEDEVGYIALHIMAAMDSYEERMRNILLVCGSGFSSSQMMKSQLTKRFGNLIDKLIVTDLKNLDNYNLDDYDFIISSIKLDIETTKPIIYVDIIFKAQDIENISQALDIKGYKEINRIFNNSIFIRNSEIKNRDEVYDLLSKKAALKTKLSKEYIKESFEQRERLGSTAYDNKVAIPHILEQVNTESFSIILILDNEIDWKDKKINLVYSLFVGDEIGDMSLYYDRLGTFLNDKTLINKALQTNNTIEFMNTFLGE